MRSYADRFNSALALKSECVRHVEQAGLGGGGCALLGSNNH